MADDGSYADNSSDDGTDEPLVPLANASNGKPNQAMDGRTLRGATRKEWRTPPLWGFRDSGPYLHDGRAQTLEQAVAMHGGQGAAAAHRFFELSPQERGQVEAFLKSLVAPTPAAIEVAQRGE
jgi:cytochrome c peroxidase